LDPSCSSRKLVWNLISIEACFSPGNKYAKFIKVFKPIAIFYMQHWGEVAVNRSDSAGVVEPV
jgi:hypothetical protein